MVPITLVATQTITVEVLVLPHAPLGADLSMQKTDPGLRGTRESGLGPGPTLPYLDFLTADELKHFGVNVFFIWRGNQNTGSSPHNHLVQKPLAPAGSMSLCD